MGAQKANQAIITRYRDGDHFIGPHFDKPSTIAESKEDQASLITVIKIGDVGRRFTIEDHYENVIWSEIISPGSALIMTLEANLKTKHSVPISSTSGDSGSIVFRSISRIISCDELQKKINTSEHQKIKRQAKKEEKSQKKMKTNSK